MQSQLQKAIDLVKKTGDKIMVFDYNKPDNIYLVMNLKDYENLVLGKSEVRGLTEDELLDKINRDIAIWKSEQNFVDNLEHDKKQFDEFDFKKDKDKKDMDLDTRDGLEIRNGLEIRKRRLSNVWSIPRNIKDAAEEVIEEDRQYLEELAF